MGDVVFDPATTPLPTRLGSRQGGTDSTTDLALVSPRIAPWLSAKTPHGSDHLLVVFSLQKPATEQSIKPHNPFRYERSGSDIVSKLRKRKPKKKSTKGARKSKKQLPWWDSETEKSVDRKVLDGSSRGLNTASMPADRAQVNQGVGKVPKPIPASLRDTLARKLGKALSRMASRQNSLRSSFSFKKTALKPVSTSNLTMATKAVTQALHWTASRGDSQTTHAIILTDSMSLLKWNWEPRLKCVDGRHPPSVVNSCGCTALDIPE